MNEMVIGPIVKDSHWRIIGVDFVVNEVVVFDSMGAKYIDENMVAKVK